jgi:hypothetical protein
MLMSVSEIRNNAGMASALLTSPPTTIKISIQPPSHHPPDLPAHLAGPIWRLLHHPASPHAHKHTHTCMKTSCSAVLTVLQYQLHSWSIARSTASAMTASISPQGRVTLPDNIHQRAGVQNHTAETDAAAPKQRNVQAATLICISMPLTTAASCWELRTGVPSWPHHELRAPGAQLQPPSRTAHSGHASHASSQLHPLPAAHCSSTRHGCCASSTVCGWTTSCVTDQQPGATQARITCAAAALQRSRQKPHTQDSSKYTSAGMIPDGAWGQR